MLVAGERVAYQDGVAALGVERAVGLVGDLERGQLDAGVELERLVGAELHHQRTRLVGFARAVGRIAVGCIAVGLSRSALSRSAAPSVALTSAIFSLRAGTAELPMAQPANVGSWNGFR